MSVSLGQGFQMAQVCPERTQVWPPRLQQNPRPEMTMRTIPEHDGVSSRSGHLLQSSYTTIPTLYSPS